MNVEVEMVYTGKDGTAIIIASEKIGSSEVFSIERRSWSGDYANLSYLPKECAVGILRVLVKFIPVHFISELIQCLANLLPQERRIYLAEDIVGKKLYYHDEKGRIVRTPRLEDLVI